MNLDEIDQLIRMSQALRVRAHHLAQKLSVMPKAPEGVEMLACDASERARDAQTLLEKVRTQLT